MKTILAATVAAFALLAAQAASAQTADDTKWVGQCMVDNAGGAPDAVVRKYCTCMNNKMDDSETRTITQWEKANPQARAACDKEAGWR